MKPNEAETLDRWERAILRELQRDARITNAKLAAGVGLSESPTFRRVKALENSGVIRGYTATLDQRKLGLPVTAFVQVTMEKQPDERTELFHRRVDQEPYIIECHAMSGTQDYLMKVVARGMDHFSELVMRQILKYPGVMHVESNFSLQPIKDAGALPCAD